MPQAAANLAELEQLEAEPASKDAPRITTLLDLVAAVVEVELLSLKGGATRLVVYQLKKS